jgi:hypothetical protein
MSISNALLRTALPAAREAARLMGSDDSSATRTGTFTLGALGPFTGVFTAADEATKMLYAGYQVNVSLICVTLCEQFTAEPDLRANLVFDGVTYRIRERKSDSLHYTLVLFRPS